MDNAGRRRNTQRRRPAGGKPKTLGRAAMRSIIKNQEAAEEFLEALRGGMLDMSRFHLGTVERALGGARFDVAIAEGSVRAGLSGMLTGRGGFFHNPEASTAVRVGSAVVVEDLGLGYMAGGRSHEIIAVLDRDQAAEAGRILRMTSSESSNVFERADEYVAAIRAAQIAEAARATTNLRPSAAKWSSSNAGSAVASRKSSSSYNLEAEMAAAATASKSEKKKRRFHKRKQTKKERRMAEAAAKKAGEAAGAGGGTTTWF